MPDVLDDILKKTRERLEAQRERLPFSDLQKQAAAQKPARPFAKALQRPDGLAIIAELKQASPSAGVIRQEDDLAGRIEGYARGGAAALSILTEEYYFHGSPYILELARLKTTLPLLRKDFIVDAYQVEESRAMGADALLLITSLLSPSQLKELLDHTRQVGMEALVETHSELDLDKALNAGARVLGINHRDLRTLKMDMTIAKRLLPLIPRDKVMVVESGIKSPEELAAYWQAGANAVLIGETLMRHSQPDVIVRSFVEGGRDMNRKSA